MRLPNADQAVVEIRKLRDYVLNSAHLRGRHKARVFASALGLRSEHADVLREALLIAAHEEEAVPVLSDVHGCQYVVEFLMNRGSRGARIRSVWIVRPDEDFPRFVSCYVM